MVGANTFRNPGLTAKLATTLDHLSGGRAVLGIGGAWFEREHDAYGIDFGQRRSASGSTGSTSPSMLLRRLLDGERITPRRPRSTTSATRSSSRGRSRPQLPILIGGSGPKKTLRTPARYADLWNTIGHGRRARGARLDPARALRGGRARPRRDRADDQLPRRHPRHARGGAARSTSAARGRRRGVRRRLDPSSPGRRAEIADGDRSRSSSSGSDTCSLDCRRRTTARRIGRIGELRRAPQRVTASRVVALAGGVGGAKLAEGLQAHLGDRLIVVVNTADDTERHGLLVCPTTTRSSTPWPGSRTRSSAGASPATRWAAMGALERVRRGGLVLGSATGTSRPTSSGPRGCGRAPA